MAESIITEPEESNLVSETGIAQADPDLAEKDKPEQTTYGLGMEGVKIPSEPEQTTYGLGMGGEKLPSQVVQDETKYSWQKDLEYAKDSQGVDVVRLPVTRPDGTQHRLEYDKNELYSIPNWRDILQGDMDEYKNVGPSSQEFIQNSIAPPTDDDGKSSGGYDNLLYPDAKELTKPRSPIPTNQLFENIVKESPSLQKWARKYGSLGGGGFVSPFGKVPGKQFPVEVPLTRENAPVLYEQLVRELSNEHFPMVASIAAAIVAGIATGGMAWLPSLAISGASVGTTYAAADIVRGTAEVLVGEEDDPESGSEIWRQALLKGQVEAIMEVSFGRGFHKVFGRLPLNARRAITDKGLHYQGILKDLQVADIAREGGEGGMLSQMGKGLGETPVSADMFVGRDLNISLSPAQMADKTGLLQTIDEMLDVAWLGGRARQMKKRTFQFINQQVDAISDRYVRSLDTLYGRNNTTEVMHKLINGEIDIHKAVAIHAEKKVVDIIDGIPALDDAGNVIAGRWLHKGVASDTGINIAHLLADKDNKKMINLIIKDHILTQKANGKLITRSMDEVLKNGRYLSASDAITLRSKIGSEAYDQYTKQAGLSTKALKDDVHKAIDDLLPAGEAKDLFALRQDQWVQVFKKRVVEGNVLKSGLNLEGETLISSIKTDDLKKLITVLKGGHLKNIKGIKIEDSEAIPVLKSMLIKDLVSANRKTGRYAVAETKYAGEEIYAGLFGKGTRGELIRQEKLSLLFNDAEIKELGDVIGLLEFAQKPSGNIGTRGTALQFAQIGAAVTLPGAATYVFWDGNVSQKEMMSLATPAAVIFGPAALARLWVRPVGRKLVKESLTNNAKGNVKAAVSVMRRALMLDSRLVEEHIAEYNDRMEGRAPALADKYGLKPPIIRGAKMQRQKYRVEQKRRETDPAPSEGAVDKLFELANFGIDAFMSGLGKFNDLIYPIQYLPESTQKELARVVEELSIKNGQTPLGPLPPRQ